MLCALNFSDISFYLDYHLVEEKIKLAPGQLSDCVRLVQLFIQPFLQTFVINVYSGLYIRKGERCKIWEKQLTGYCVPRENISLPQQVKNRRHGPDRSAWRVSNSGRRGHNRRCPVRKGLFWWMVYGHSYRLFRFSFTAGKGMKCAHLLYFSCLPFLPPRKTWYKGSRADSFVFVIGFVFNWSNGETQKGEKGRKEKQYNDILLIWPMLWVTSTQAQM